MLEVQHLQFLCIVFEFQLIGQIGYWQLKPTRTSKSKLKNGFPKTVSKIRIWILPYSSLLILGGFFDLYLYLYSGPVSLKISVLLLNHFKNQEKIEKKCGSENSKKWIKEFLINPYLDSAIGHVKRQNTFRLVNRSLAQLKNIFTYLKLSKALHIHTVRAEANMDFYGYWIEISLLSFSFLLHDSRF